jgi:hypothetical protein
MSLPTRQYKKVTVTHGTKKTSKPLNPTFCPIIHEDAEKKCGNMLTGYDGLFFNQYGMCEECFNKYQPVENNLVVDEDDRVVEKTEE